jgi:hypothetical protein
MNVSKADIEKAIRQSVGDPDSGPIHDHAAVMAEAVADLLKPESKKENRIIKAAEIPAAEERID